MIKKVMRSDALRSLCIRKNWFTSGSIGQYEKLFDANDAGESIDTLATIIWVCSSNVGKRDVIVELEKAHEEYVRYDCCEE